MYLPERIAYQEDGLRLDVGVRVRPGEVVRHHRPERRDVRRDRECDALVLRGEHRVLRPGGKGRPARERHHERSRPDASSRHLPASSLQRIRILASRAAG